MWKKRLKKRDRFPLAREYSRRMREKMTEGEKAMCSILESLEYKYESQKAYLTEHNMGGFYIADFKIPYTKVLVEIDGRHHILNKEQFIYDRKRDKFFTEEGFTVLRFSNMQVLKYPEVVKEKLSKFVKLQLDQRREKEEKKKKKQLKEEEKKKRRLERWEKKKNLLRQRSKTLSPTAWRRVQLYASIKTLDADSRKRLQKTVSVSSKIEENPQGQRTCLGLYILRSADLRKPLRQY